LSGKVRLGQVVWIFHVSTGYLRLVQVMSC